VIAALYDAAFRVPIDDFQNFALELMRGIIPFDAASWTVVNNDLMVAQSMASINQSQEVLIDYLINWERVDFLSHHISANPGSSYRREDLMPDDEWLALPMYQQFCRRIGLEHTL
jgi:hypothetical protein